MLGSTVVQNTTFVFPLPSRSVLGGFYLVYCIPCLLMCRCTIFVFLDFLRCLLISFLLRHSYTFRNPCLVELMRLVVVGLNSAACKYCDSSVFDVCARKLFVTDSDCLVSRDTSQIPVFLFLVPLIIYFPFFWTNISCFSSVMVHP